ncbi:unnamed protein product, partial [Linum tenue]
TGNFGSLCDNQDIAGSFGEHENNQAAGGGADIPPVLRRARPRRMLVVDEIHAVSGDNDGGILLLHDADRDRGGDMHHVFTTRTARRPLWTVVDGLMNSASAGILIYMALVGFRQPQIAGQHAAAARRVRLASSRYGSR